jgi:hypothetical protein
MQAFHFRFFPFLLSACRVLAQDVTLISSPVVPTNVTAGLYTTLPTPPISVTDSPSFVSSLSSADVPTAVPSTDSAAPSASPGVFAPASIIGVVDISSALDVPADGDSSVEVTANGGAWDDAIPHTTLRIVTTARRPPADFTGTAVGIIMEGPLGSSNVAEATSTDGQDTEIVSVTVTVTATATAADDGLTVQSDEVVVPAFKPTRYRVLPLAWAFRTDRET